MIGFYQKQAIEGEFEEKLDKALICLGLKSVMNSIIKVLTKEQLEELKKQLNGK